MSISATLSISSSSYASAASASEKSNPMKDAMDTLGKALESGDMDAAKTAFAAIQKNGPQGGPGGPRGAGRPSGPPPPPPTDTDTDSTSSSSSTSSTDPKAAFEALSKALESGDLESAKSAYSTLQSALEKGPGARKATQGSNSATLGTADPYAEYSGSTLSLQA